MLEIRAATPDDAETITVHRRNMFHEMENTDPVTLASMAGEFEPWVRDRLLRGRYLGWLAIESGQVVAGLGLLLLDWPPHYLDPSHSERAYLLNLYVEPAYRRQKLASRLLDLALAEARRRQIRVTALHASDAGKPLYKSKGFRASNEMFLVDSE